MSYMTHPINQSATIYGEAGAAITAPAMKVVAFDGNGKFVLPTTGTPIGVVLSDAVDVAAGDRIDKMAGDMIYEW